MTPQQSGPNPSEDQGPKEQPKLPSRELNGSLMVGEWVGPYQVRSFLGIGGFGAVYLGQDTNGSTAALKVSSIAGGGKYLYRFNDVTNERSPRNISPDEIPAEAIFDRKSVPFIDFLDWRESSELLRKQHQILAKANHPNLIGLKEPGLIYHIDQPILAMEYVAGKTLRQRIRNRESVKIDWFLEVAGALDSLHKSGQLDAHRSLKPEDILITNSGKIKILDPSPHPDNLAGVFITSPYHNPLLRTDSRADVMAIGVMLYEVTTGVFPFKEVPYERAYQKVTTETDDLYLSYFLSFPPVRQLNPTVSVAFGRIIHHCLCVPDYGLSQLASDLSALLK